MAGPESYTHGHHPAVVAAHARRTAEEAARFLLPYLRSDMRLLDVGCGPGSITAGLTRYAGCVVGVDQAPEVLPAPRPEDDGRSEDPGPAAPVFLAASAYRLPFASESFDAAYAHQLLQHLAEPLVALGEMWRVLRPGGVIGVRDADYATMVHHPHDPRLERWLDIYHQVARANGGEPDAGRRLPEWLADAGFESIRFTTSTWTFATPAERRHWAELWAERIADSHFADRAEQLGVSDRSELAGIGAAFRAWAENPVGTFSFVNGEAVGRRHP